jgi:hypothetical protein
MSERRVESLILVTKTRQYTSRFSRRSNPQVLTLATVVNDLEATGLVSLDARRQDSLTDGLQRGVQAAGCARSAASTPGLAR